MQRYVPKATFSLLISSVISLSQDIDECREAALMSSVICPQPNTQCVNTNGSFQCVCVDGYEVAETECQRECCLTVVHTSALVVLTTGIADEVIEPPEVIVPELGQENAITFTVETYEIQEVF